MTCHNAKHFTQVLSRNEHNVAQMTVTKYISQSVLFENTIRNGSTDKR